MWTQSIDLYWNGIESGRERERSGCVVASGWSNCHSHCFFQCASTLLCSSSSSSNNAIHSIVTLFCFQQSSRPKCSLWRLMMFPPSDSSQLQSKLLFIIIIHAHSARTSYEWQNTQGETQRKIFEHYFMHITINFNTKTLYHFYLLHAPSLLVMECQSFAYACVRACTMYTYL